MPAGEVIPELVYEDIGAAIEWLCDAFGFTLRWRAGDHRAQLAVGDSAVALMEQRAGFRPPQPGDLSQAVLVRVEDAHGHHERASAHGARILQPPADHPYGERQYRAEDFAGHHWTFSETIADVAPEDWGGTTG
jgi:uncharacterized glyoxalase superfamily protein PhnB